MRRWSIAFLSISFFAVVSGYFIARFRGDGPVVAATAVPVSNRAGSRVPGDGAARVADSSKLDAARRILSGVSSDIEPLKDVFAELSAQAKAGKLDAATRLYRDLSRCRSLPGLESTISTLSDEILKKAMDGMDSSQLEGYQAELDSVELNKENLQRLHHLCDGVTDRMYADRYWAVQKAAELGDADARACVLQQGPSLDMRSLAAQPQLIDHYRVSVPSLIRSGIADGDWRVVEIVSQAYGADSDNLLGGLLDTDPVQRYRYLKLYRLGYHLDYELYSSAQLDAKVAAAASSLDATQLAQADAWAQDTFRNQFRGSEVSESTMTWGNACGF